jgi:hypothetical protein
MKCIGTHKETYGLGCRTEQPQRKLGLGIECGCYRDFLLNTEAGKTRIQRATLKASKPRRDLEKATQNHKSNKSLSTLIESVKKVCHQYIRERDKGKPCISCGSPWHDKFEAGHLFKAQLFSTIKFDERNINGQCPQCNNYREGNESAYHLRLPERIGKGSYALLVKLAEKDKRTDFKWNRQALIEIRKYYRNKLKELNNGKS